MSYDQQHVLWWLISLVQEVTSAHGIGIGVVVGAWQRVWGMKQRGKAKEGSHAGRKEIFYEQKQSGWRTFHANGGQANWKDCRAAWFEGQETADYIPVVVKEKWRNKMQCPPPFHLNSLPVLLQAQ